MLPELLSLPVVATYSEVPVSAAKPTLAIASVAPSALETAVTVTVDWLVTVDGAVYRPSGVMVPTEALPPFTPFTFQIAAVSVAPVTLTENC